MTANGQTGAGFSVIIPVYNEAEVIAQTIARTHQVWPEACIIVVDDGSTDSTADLVKTLDVPHLVLHRYRANRGKGFAVSRGIDLAETPFTLQLDADGQFPPEAMPRLAAPLLEGKARVVFCSRYCAGATREAGSVSNAKRLASLLASGFVSVIVRQRLTDVFAGFKCWDTDFVQSLGLAEGGFGYEAELAIKAFYRGGTILEIPISYAARRVGESKIVFSRDLITVPLSILRVWLVALWNK
jgi:glycosyltransferase involved in cell wall biosynthesis